MRDEPASRDEIKAARRFFSLQQLQSTSDELNAASSLVSSARFELWITDFAGSLQNCFTVCLWARFVESERHFLKGHWIIIAQRSSTKLWHKAHFIPVSLLFFGILLFLARDFYDASGKITTLSQNNREHSRDHIIRAQRRPKNWPKAPISCYVINKEFKVTAFETAARLTGANKRVVDQDANCYSPNGRSFVAGPSLSWLAPAAKLTNCKTINTSQLQTVTEIIIFLQFCNFASSPIIWQLGQLVESLASGLILGRRQSGQLCPFMKTIQTWLTFCLLRFESTDLKIVLFVHVHSNSDLNFELQ